MRAPGAISIVLIFLASCGGSGDDAASPDAGGPSGERAGCEGATFLGTSGDPAARGPWDVGARTVTVGRMRVEVWYPAAPGAATGDAAVYDLREALPASMQGDIPDADNPWQPCDCERDLPIDEAHGPYPVVVFVHGTAAFRHQSLSLMTHWASRGFVVVAADHPGLMLGDFLARICPDDPTGEQDLAADLDALLGALAAPSGDLAFLAGRVAADRVAVSGHSAGGGAAAGASGKPGVRVVIPLAANASTAPSATLEEVLYMGGIADTIARWDAVQSAYQESPSPRSLVGVSDSGHLFCSDLCDTRNAEGQDLLAIAQEHQLCGAEFAGFLFDCDPGYLDGAVAREIVEHATTTVLETVLQCRDDLPPLAEIGSAYPDVGAFDEAR